MEQQRGRLTPLSQRQILVKLVNQAITSGARKHKACQCVGISLRTYQRWYANRQLTKDLREQAKRSAPINKLTDKEEQRIIDVCLQDDFVNLTPHQIVPELADKGIYIASESTFYRILRKHDLLGKRVRRKHQGKSRNKPSAINATGPNQLWTWDISYLANKVIGMHFYLYLIIDVYSRKIVGSEVYESENGEFAAELMQRAAWREKCVDQQLILHSDNGAPMRSYTLKAKLDDLGIQSSYSRPRVSNDNPFSESMFKTLKYCPQWPKDGFETLEDARDWVHHFVNWYNNEHKHSGIQFVTPNQRHDGDDVEILRKRDVIYQKARQQNPARWGGKTRNWEYIDKVSLNPDKKPKKTRQHA